MRARFTRFLIPTQGVKSQKMRSRQNAERGRFALLGSYLGMHSRTIRTLFALPRLYFLPQEMWMHSQPSSAVLRGTSNIIVWDSVHTVYRTLNGILALPCVPSTAGHVPAELSTGGGQNHFRLTPVTFPSCKGVYNY